MAWWVSSSTTRLDCGQTLPSPIAVVVTPGAPETLVKTMVLIGSDPSLRRYGPVTSVGRSGRHHASSLRR